MLGLTSAGSARLARRKGDSTLYNTAPSRGGRRRATSLASCFLGGTRLTALFAAAVVGVTVLAGCAPTSTKETTSTDSALGSNYQEVIAAGLQARPTIGFSITIADYPSLDAAAEAWSDAYFACLFSGNIPLSEDEFNAYFMGMEKGFKDEMPTDFKLDENWKTCTSNLFDTTDAAIAISTAAEGQNEVVVLNQALGTSEAAPSRFYNTLSTSGDGASIKFRTEYTLYENGKVAGQSEFAGVLSNKAGILKYTDHL